jgi:hypothetical protein
MATAIKTSFLKARQRQAFKKLVFMMRIADIAKKELASTNQNPRIEWRRGAPPRESWGFFAN